MKILITLLEIKKMFNKSRIVKFYPDFLKYKIYIIFSLT